LEENESKSREITPIAATIEIPCLATAILFYLIFIFCIFYREIVIGLYLAICKRCRDSFTLLASLDQTEFHLIPAYAYNTYSSNGDPST